MLYKFFYRNLFDYLRDYYKIRDRYLSNPLYYRMHANLIESEFNVDF